jgi:hypothetical protein
MALVGDLIKYDVIQSETETETISITYPDNLPLNDPDYDLRGKTIDSEVPKNIETQQIYSNVYVVVHSINSWKQKIGSENKTLMNINYRVYESKDNRLNDTEMFIFEDHLVAQDVDYSLGKNEIQQSYDLVKNIRGFEQLKNY